MVIVAISLSVNLTTAMKNTFTMRLLLGSTLLGFLTGCSGNGFSPESPDSLTTVGNPYAAAQTNTSSTDLNPQKSLANDIDRYYEDQSVEPAERRRIRDKVVYFVAGEIDINYQKFSNSFFIDQAWTETALDVAVIGLGSAGSLTGGASLKAILAASSAGLTGSRTSFVKNFFKDKSPEIVLARMDALRAAQWASIYQKLDSPDDSSRGSYSLSEASRDLLLYYNSGTVKAAFQDIVKESGNIETKADDTLQSEIEARYGTSHFEPESKTEFEKLEQRLWYLQKGILKSSNGNSVTGNSEQFAKAVLAAFGVKNFSGSANEYLSYLFRTKDTRTSAGIVKMNAAFDTAFKNTTK